MKTKPLTVEQARLAVINAADSYGVGSAEHKTASRVYDRAVKVALTRASFAFQPEAYK